MTEQLPYSDLFPYLHPLQVVDIEKYPLIKPVIAEFVWEHTYYVTKYLDTDKLVKATEYLQDHGIKEIIANFDITDFKKTVGKLNIGRHKQEVWVIWLFVSAAFILINRAITENSITQYTEDIKLCFRNAHDYKRLWCERKCRYKGATKTNNQRGDLKQAALNIIKEKCTDRNTDEYNYDLFKTEFDKRYPNSKSPFSKSAFSRRDSSNPLVQAKML